MLSFRIEAKTVTLFMLFFQPQPLTDTKPIPKDTKIVTEKVVDALIDDDWDSLLKLVVQFDTIISHLHFDLLFVEDSTFEPPKFRSILSYSSATTNSSTTLYFGLISLSSYLGSHQCFRKLHCFTSRRLRPNERIALLKYATVGRSPSIFREIHGIDLLMQIHMVRMDVCYFIVTHGSLQIFKFLYFDGIIIGYHFAGLSRRHLLCTAAYYGHIGTVKFYVHESIDSSFHWIFQNIFEECCRGGSIDVLEYLLHFHDIRSLKLLKVIEFAISGGSLSVVKYLHKKFDRFEDLIVESVKLAISNEKWNILNFLLTLDFFGKLDYEAVPSFIQICSKHNCRKLPRLLLQRFPISNDDIVVSSLSRLNFMKALGPDSYLSVFCAHSPEFLSHNELLQNINSESRKEFLISLFENGTMKQITRFVENTAPIDKGIAEQHLLCISISLLSIKKVEYLLSFGPNVDSLSACRSDVINYFVDYISPKEFSLQLFLDFFFEHDSRASVAFRIFKLICFKSSKLTKVESKYLKRRIYSKAFIKYFCFSVLPSTNISLSTPITFLQHKSSPTQFPIETPLVNLCPLVIKFVFPNMRSDIFKELFWFQVATKSSPLRLISLLHFLIYRRLPIDIINLVLAHVGNSSLLEESSKSLLKLSISQQYYEVVYSLSKYPHKFEPPLEYTSIGSAFYAAFLKKYFPLQHSESKGNAHFIPFQFT
jgi:hypothetical protein